ncbi:MAG: TetR/AcrR family transcriptional regulator [Pseudomonadota bacterium]
MKLTEKKRSDIVAAAIEEFRTNGFRAAHVNAIAERASVSKRTLYRHFSSKDALFDEIVNIIMAQNASIRHITFDPELPVRDQFVREAQAIVDQVADADYIGLNRLIASEYLLDKERALQVFSRDEVTADPLAGFIKEAMEAGALRNADPRFASMQFSGLLKQFFVWPQFLLGDQPQFNQSQSEIIGDCVDMFLGHYAHRP